MNHNSVFLPIMLIVVIGSQCNWPDKTLPKQKTIIAPPSQPALVISYHAEPGESWLKNQNPILDSARIRIVLAVNRTDLLNLAKMPSILVPDDLNGEIALYLPFPLSVPYLENISKIIFFSYPAQVFGAYEHGRLVYTGPTNMGRKTAPTPQGIYYTNWKGEKITSSVDDEWELSWYFNIDNKAGIGWHQYGLPGYPASHSCLRLQEGDARYLYAWAEQWIVQGKDLVVANGTPVIVFGAYNFDAPKPWLQLLGNSHALDITAAALEQEVAAHLIDILAQQKKREDVASLAGQ
jgi:hypothetical protein